MKLILQKDVKNLGKTGDQVSVKKGFARNFLIPKGYAILLNKDRLKVWKHQQIIIDAKKRKAISERKALIEKLSSIKLKFEKESQKDSKIFGSVTAYEISQALEKLHNIHIDKRDIHFSELKTLGDYKINIRLDSENQTEMNLTIKRKTSKKREQFVKVEPEKTVELQKEEPSDKNLSTEPQKEELSEKSLSQKTKLTESTQEEKVYKKEKVSIPKKQVRKTDRVKESKQTVPSDTEEEKVVSSVQKDKKEKVETEKKAERKQKPEASKKSEKETKIEEKVVSKKDISDSDKDKKTEVKKSSGFFRKFLGKK